MFGTRSIVNLTVVVAALVLTAGLSSSTFAQNLLTNGDFEDLTGWGVPGDETLPASWIHEESPTRKNPAQKQSGANAIGGSGTSAYMPGFPSSDNTVRRDMWNVGDTTWPQWTLQYDFASEDPGADNDRSLSCAVELSNSNRITHRVTDVGQDGIGDLQIYDGANWQLVLSNAVAFDPDVTTTPVVNHITFTGHFDEASPVYDVTITNGLGTFTATGLAYYRYSPGSRPVTGAEGLNFNTFLAPGDGVGNYLVDNAVLTHVEPVRPEQYITNGDFEDTTGWGLPGTMDFPPGWTVQGIRTNAAAMASGSAAIGGVGTSAYMESFPSTDEATRREIRQTFSAPTTTDWQFDFDLAAAAAGLPLDVRSLSCELAGFDGGKLMLRVVDPDLNNVGDLQLYNGSAWESVAGLNNSITLDDDLTSALLANHVTIVGHYGEDTPSYDIVVTDANSGEFSAADLTIWAGSGPASHLGGLSGVVFNTFNSESAYVIDNVSLVDLQTAMIPGDATGDGQVDTADAERLASYWGATEQAPGMTWWQMGDFNESETIDAADAAILAANWGYGVSEEAGQGAVPEPSLLVVLATAAYALLWLCRRS